MHPRIRQEGWACSQKESDRHDLEIVQGNLSAHERQRCTSCAHGMRMRTLRRSLFREEGTVKDIFLSAIEGDNDSIVHCLENGLLCFIHVQMCVWVPGLVSMHKGLATEGLHTQNGLKRFGHFLPVLEPPIPPCHISSRSLMLSLELCWTCSYHPPKFGRKSNHHGPDLIFSSCVYGCCGCLPKMGGATYTLEGIQNLAGYPSSMTLTNQN